jgi:hypothetical protein
MAIGDRWRKWQASEERFHVMRSPRDKLRETRRPTTPDEERIAHLAKLEARAKRRAKE